MKFYLPLIASIFLASASCGSPIAKTQAQNIAQKPELVTQAPEIDPYIKDNIAREITVKVSSEENGGSGVIIAQQNNTYLILTNAHVLRDDNSFTIQTHDGITYQAQPIDSGIETDDDLALLEFSSDKDYQTATINSAATPKAEQAILAAGYSAETGELLTEEGRIKRLPDKTLKDGYEIGYSSDIVQGMSGGAILNVDGEVIGINGKSAFPIVNTGYTYQDGTKPTSAEIEQLRKLSWGLSVNRLLTQLNPELITAYGLPLPETTAKVETPQLTGWLGELEEKAKQITVRIDSSSGANGSGVIIAKEGNTYTVLTANHVLCEKDDANECIDYGYEIVAPDSEKYSVDASTINRQEGVDLAVVRFTSEENYQVAELANYPLAGGDAVFVAGYPQLSNTTPAKWLFSLGLGSEKEQGLLDVNDSSLSTDNYGLTSSQGSLAGGYEMVYSNITYGGMSGGAVLDKDARVIGIHGLAEGETALDSQGSSATKIQLGYSLGIPVNTFVELVDKLKINSALPRQDNRPRELNRAELETFVDAILGTAIPQDNATAESWLERGNQLWRLFRYDEAVKAFDRVIALKPKFIHLAYYGKGLTLWYKNEDEAALASLESAINAEPTFVAAISTKASLLRSLNRWNEALVIIEAAIALQNDKAKLYSEKGWILSKLKKYSEAEAAYNQAIQLSPRLSFYSNRAVLYNKQGKIDSALADYNQALKINPQNDQIYYNRGNLYAQIKKNNLALADYNQAIKLNFYQDDAHNNRGLIYKRQGKNNLALADYNQAIKLNSNSVSAYYNRGNLYAQQKRGNLALADYTKVIELAPKDSTAYYSRGNVYSDLQKSDLALADYSKAIDINPQFANAYYNRGNIYYKQKNLDLALVDYGKAIDINPQFANAIHNRGLIYYKQKKFELALSEYDRVIEINRQFARAYYSRGNVYFEQEKFDKALNDYIKSVQLDPSYKNATEAISITYFRQGNIYHKQKKAKLAIAKYSKAIDVSPHYVEALRMRGSLFYDLKKLDLALADYNRAVKINPDDPLANFLLGGTHLKLENDTAAISSFKKARQLYLAQNNTAGAERVSTLLKILEQTPTETTVNNSQSEYIDPNDAQAYFDRGLGYHKQEKLELALADYNRAIEIEPTNNHIYYYNRGGVYLKQKEFNLALADFEKAINIDSSSAESYAGLGAAHEQMGDLEDAKLNLEKAQQLALSQGSNNYADKIANILVKYSKEEYESSVKDNLGDVSTVVKYALHHFRLGNLYSGDKKYDLAEASYGRAIKLNPNVIHYCARGNFYKKQGRVDSALTDYGEAIEKFPESAFLYCKRGELYYEQEKISLALADFNRAIMLNPQKDDKAYYNRGLLYAEQGKIDLAVADYTKAIETHRFNVKAYYSRGLLYQRKNEYSLARSDLEKAKELFVAWDDTAGTEKVNDSLKILEQAQTKTATNDNQNESIDPNDAQVYFDRALNQHENNEVYSAIDNYSKAIELDRNHEKALINRGLLYASRKEDELAIEDYDRAIAINPNNSRTYINRGVVYFQQEEYELALTDFDDAINHDPNDALAYYNRGLLYQKREEFDLARRDLEKAEELYLAQNDKVEAEKISKIVQDMPSLADY